MAKLHINSKLRMNSGFEIPIVGYGVFQTPDNETEAAVSHSLKTGYRQIDSAFCYYNEAACARAMAASGLSRSSLFYTSKIYLNTLTYDGTVSQINTILKRTSLEYIDLLLIHAPFGGSAGRKGAWLALVEAQESGKVRSIGISNYGMHHLAELETHIAELEAERGIGRGGAVDVGQWELHPWLARAEIVAWCRRHGVVVQAYCPITRAKRLDDPLLLPIVRRTGKTAAQVLMRWSLQMGFVPLPKSVTPWRIEENINVFDFELSSDEMLMLETCEYWNSAWDPTGSPLSI